MKQLRCSVTITRQLVKHILREFVERGDIKLQKVESKINVVDPITKALALKEFVGGCWRYALDQICHVSSNKSVFVIIILLSYLLNSYDNVLD